MFNKILISKIILSLAFGTAYQSGFSEAIESNSNNRDSGVLESESEFEQKNEDSPLDAIFYSKSKNYSNNASKKPLVLSEQSESDDKDDDYRDRTYRNYDRRRGLLDLFENRKEYNDFFDEIIYYSVGAFLSLLPTVPLFLKITAKIKHARKHAKVKVQRAQKIKNEVEEAKKLRTSKFEAKKSPNTKNSKFYSATEDTDDDDIYDFSDKGSASTAVPRGTQTDALQKSLEKIRKRQNEHGTRAALHPTTAITQIQRSVNPVFYEISQTDDFHNWYEHLSDVDQNQINTRIANIQAGRQNISSRNLHSRLAELRFGNGTRIYYTLTEEKRTVRILLLFGGNKNGQEQDIKHARNMINILNKQ